VTQTLCRDNGASAAGWVQVDTQTAGNPADDVLVAHPAPAGRPTWSTSSTASSSGPSGWRMNSLCPPRTAPPTGQQGRVAGLPERRRQDRGRYRLALPTPATAGQWINSSEVRPRFLVRRWDATTNSYSRLILDTDLLDPTTLLSAISPNNNNLLGLAPGTNYTLACAGTPRPRRPPRQLPARYRQLHRGGRSRPELLGPGPIGGRLPRAGERRRDSRPPIRPPPAPGTTARRAPPPATCWTPTAGDAQVPAGHAPRGYARCQDRR